MQASHRAARRRLPQEDSIVSSAWHGRAGKAAGAVPPLLGGLPMLACGHAFGGGFAQLSFGHRSASGRFPL